MEGGRGREREGGREGERERERGRETGREVKEEEERDLVYFKLVLVIVCD